MEQQVREMEPILAKKAEEVPTYQNLIIILMCNYLLCIIYIVFIYVLIIGNGARSSTQSRTESCGRSEASCYERRSGS